MVVEMKFWEKIKLVCTNPQSFFKAIESETEIKTSIMFYIYLQIIVLPFGILVGWITGQVDTLLKALVFPLAFVFGLFVFFLMLLIYHGIITLFGGKQGLLRTFQAFIYGATPALLLSWIPIVNIIVSFYSMYLNIIGLIQLQKMEKHKAILAYFTPIIIVLVISLILGITIFTF